MINNKIPEKNIMVFNFHDFFLSAEVFEFGREREREKYFE